MAIPISNTKDSQDDILRVSKRHKIIDLGVESKTLKLDEKTIAINENDSPEIVVMERCRGIKISKYGLSPKALLLLRKLASYANPEFYAKQAMRLSTYGTPRISVVYDEEDESIILPRGVEVELLKIFDENKIKYLINDTRYNGEEVQIEFKGKLTDKQEEAFCELNKFNDGVLAAATGERVIIVMGAIYVIKSRASETFIKYNSCIA